MTSTLQLQPGTPRRRKKDGGKLSRPNIALLLNIYSAQYNVVHHSYDKLGHFKHCPKYHLLLLVHEIKFKFGRQFVTKCSAPSLQVASLAFGFSARLLALRERQGQWCVFKGTIVMFFCHILG
jgi:hypothetical protein